MDTIAATSALRPQPTRIAPVFDEERTAPATVAAAGAEAQPQQNPKFSDLVAIFNPLQHLPIVGTIYRKLTDDVPHPAARALGGALWGGPFGLLGAILSYVAEQVSGKDTSQIVKSIFDGGNAKPTVAEQTQETPADAGAPRRLLPGDDAGAPPARADAATPSLVQAGARGAPTAPAPVQPQAAAMPASELRPRSTGTRDLAFYQAHASGRLPPASSATAPASGPQAAAQLPSFHRAVAPVLGSDPIGAATAPRAQTAPTAAARAMSPDAAQVSPQDFMQRMMRGIDQYQALNRSLDAQTRSLRLDRVE